MAQVALLGIHPENEHGHRFEADAWTWRSLARLLVVVRPELGADTAAGLLCTQDGAECSAYEASILQERLEFLLEKFDPMDVVAATAVTWWGDKGTRESVDLFDYPDLALCVETIAALQGFLRGSDGFVVKSRMESPDGNGIH